MWGVSRLCDSFECPAFVTQREDLSSAIGENLNHETIITALPGDKDQCNAVKEYCEYVMHVKEQSECECQKSDIARNIRKSRRQQIRRSKHQENVNPG